MQSTASTVWSDRIRQLLAELKMSQAGLAERLGVSPATVSRWIKGKNEPTAETYVALGNLARKPLGLYFWERAGMDVSDLPEATFRKMMASLRVNLREIKIVSAQRVSRKLAGKGHAVAIPLLAVSAFGDHVPPHENVSLSQVPVEDVLLAPLSWCPHPEQMIAMHFRGDSMMPLIVPGSVIFVDTQVRDRGVMANKLALVAHRDLGFKVARFQRIQNADLLISANHKYSPLDVSNASKWKIFGEVLWWVSRDPDSTP
ncbi:MAG TPA: S24 family peptidase [Acidobacteriaceae bacterium]|nr:S24 family peptidase [Acidobacteriaceae bacterium]